jgi:hypothetical protein
MKKYVLIAVCGVAGLASCTTKEKAMSDTEKQAKVDSIVGTRLEELSTAATEDFDRRKTIEVKQKADSIVEAYKQTNGIN